jgi:hypothetical protein
MPENYATKSRFYGSTFSLERRRAAPFPADLDGRRDRSLLYRQGAQGQAFGYFDDEPQRRSAAGMLTRDEARRIAANVAREDYFAVPSQFDFQGAVSQNDRRSAPAVLRHRLSASAIASSLAEDPKPDSKVAGINRRLVPRRARLEGGEPSH